MGALVFCEGFDKYGTNNVVGPIPGSAFLGDWTVGSFSGSGLVITAPLSANGYAFAGNSSSGWGLTANLSALTRVVGSIRYQIKNAVNGTRIGFQNGATDVFTFALNASTGAVELRTGSRTGALIATGGAGAINITHVLSFDITIGASASYAVFLDGVALYSGTANTGNGQTSANGFVIGDLLGSSITVFDDIVLFDPTNPAYNSSVLTQNIVVETQFPTSDNQTQFVNDGNTVWPVGRPSSVSYDQGLPTTAGNNIFVQKITPLVGCTISSIGLVGASSNTTVKLRGAIYNDASPPALLSSGTEVVGTTNGSTIVLPLTTPQALVAGQSYWIGFLHDTSIFYYRHDSASNLCQTKANTYASGFPATLTGMTTGAQTLRMWGNCTGSAASFASVGMNPPANNSLAQIHSNTVGAMDLYNFPVLASNPANVYGAAVKGYVMKSDSGLRTVNLAMRSGASDSAGSDPGQPLSMTAVQWQRSFFDVDPATGLPWTVVGMNGAKSGISIAS